MPKKKAEEKTLNLDSILFRFYLNVGTICVRPGTPVRFLKSAI